MSIEVDEVLDKLPSFSPSVNKLLEALKQDFVEPKELESLLLSCPVIAGRVLQISNSSFYGFSRQIDSLREACVILGQHTLRSLIYTLAVLGDYRDEGDRTNQLSYDAVWKHSLYSACLARVCGEAHERNGNNLFTSALFEHLGLIVLDNFNPAWLPSAITLAAQGKHTVQDAVSEVTGLNYLEVSFKALEYWNFPNEVCQTIQSVYDGTDSPDQHILNLSNVVADGFAYGISNSVCTVSLKTGVLDEVFNNEAQALALLGACDALFAQLAKDFLGQS